MTCQLGAEMVPIHKLSPWTDTFGWVVRNGETQSDDMLAQGFLHVAGEFSLCGVRWRKEGRWGFQAVQGMSRIST